MTYLGRREGDDMPESSDAFSVEDKAKAKIEVVALARILQMTAAHLRAVLAESVLSEFVELVGKNELVADIRSIERIAASMREDADRYMTGPSNDEPWTA